MPTGDTTDVTSTLTDLERKLVDLERQLGSVAADPAAGAAHAAAPRPPAPPDAPLRVEDLRGEIADLVRFRDQLEAAARELVTEYDRLVARLRQGPGGPVLPAPPVPGPPPIAVPQPPPAAFPTPPPPAPVTSSLPPRSVASPHADRSYEGAVEVDAGPFNDIATLQAFEQGLARVEGADDVYVKSFEGNRALIDVRLSDPVALVRQLQERLSMPITTREAGDSRLTVDVEPPDPNGT